MDKDYANFVARMGSFDDELEISQDEIEHSMPKIVTRNRSALMHFGIKGMRWGRRRNPDRTSSRNKHIDRNTLRATNEFGQKSAELGKTINTNRRSRKLTKETKNLSNDELKSLTERLELENRYMNATTKQTGMDRVNTILSTSLAGLGVATSALGLYEAIKKVKGGS